MKVIARTGAIFDGIIGLFFVVACVLLIITMLSVNLDVVMRYFVGQTYPWLPEVNEYALLFITFLSTTWILKKGGHVRMDLVLNRLSPKAKTLLNLATNIFAAAIWFVIAWYTSQLTWGMFQERERIATLLEPLKAPLVAVIPICSFLIFIQLMKNIYGYMWSILGQKTIVKEQPTRIEV